MPGGTNSFRCNRPSSLGPSFGGDERLLVGPLGRWFGPRIDDAWSRGRRSDRVAVVPTGTFAAESPLMIRPAHLVLALGLSWLQSVEVAAAPPNVLLIYAD